MSRPLRIEFPNAWYHMMSRGASYRYIFNNDTPHALFGFIVTDNQNVSSGTSWFLFNG